MARRTCVRLTQACTHVRLAGAEVQCCYSKVKLDLHPLGIRLSLELELELEMETLM